MASKDEFACHLCENTYSREQTLNDHIVTFHEGRRDFPCELCPKEFFQKIHLETHMARVHDKIWVNKFDCKKCEKNFGSLAELERHVTGVHDLERPFPCTECEEAFAQQGGLTRHVDAVHKKIALYRCRVQGCKRKLGFPNEANRNRHELTHSTDRPWKCAPCQFAGKLKADLTKHQKTKKHKTMMQKL